VLHATVRVIGHDHACGVSSAKEVLVFAATKSIMVKAETRVVSPETLESV
jgi:hypothetical protein